MDFSSFSKSSMVHSQSGSSVDTRRWEAGSIQTSQRQNLAGTSPFEGANRNQIAYGGGRVAVSPHNIGHRSLALIPELSDARLLIVEASGYAHNDTSQAVNLHKGLSSTRIVSADFPSYAAPYSDFNCFIYALSFMNYWKYRNESPGLTLDKIVKALLERLKSQSIVPNESGGVNGDNVLPIYGYKQQIMRELLGRPIKEQVAESVRSPFVEPDRLNPFTRLVGVGIPCPKAGDVVGITLGIGGVHTIACRAVTDFNCDTGEGVLDCRNHPLQGGERFILFVDRNGVARGAIFAPMQRPVWRYWSPWVIRRYFGDIIVRVLALSR